MEKSSNFIRSNTFFFRKILEKYQMGKRGRFRFPVMILFKNAGYSLPQKINLNVLIQFHFHNQSVVSSLSAMGVQSIKEFIKNELGIKEHAQILKKITDGYTAVAMKLVQGYISMMPHSILSDYSGYRNRIFSLNMIFGESFQGIAGSRIVHSMFGHECPAILFERYLSRTNILGHIYPKSVYSVSHGGIVDRFLSQFNYMQVINPRMHGAGNDRKDDTRKLAQKGSTSIINSVFEHNTPAVLLNNDSIYNSNLKFDSYQQSNNALSIGNLKMLSGQGKLQTTYPQPVGMRSDLEQANIQYIPSSQNKGTYQYFLMHRSPVNIAQTSLMLNPISQKIVRNIFMNIWKNMNPSDNDPQNFFRFSKHLMKNNGYTFPGSPKSSFGKKGTSFMMKNENYIFNKTLKTEQEVDDLKKMIIETKKTLAEKSISYPSKNSGKPNIDINRIADQVYQNIERRIRIERERKGL
jgi:hypothetical protein